MHFAVAVAVERWLEMIWNASRHKETLTIKNTKILWVSRQMILKLVCRKLRNDWNLIIMRITNNSDASVGFKKNLKNFFHSKFFWTIIFHPNFYACLLAELFAYKHLKFCAFSSNKNFIFSQFCKRASCFKVCLEHDKLNNS